MSVPPSPSGWRAHALDGALLLFHGATGTNVRFAGPGTRHLVRRLPRTVLFGLSNACNLACTFCSRDTRAPNTWTADTALDMLAGLARHGVLEVAFGGGEPFVARAFEGLLARLAEETPLVANVTTNGTRIDAALAARLRGRVGEVRVSLYDDNPWERVGRLLADAGVRGGANVLATPASLPTLANRIARAARAGYRDVAVLSYVGPDTEALLHDDDLRELSAVIADSPLPVRVSACVASRLPGVPFAGPNRCAAGHDYVALTADGRLKGCSFPRDGVPVATADDVVRAWEAHRAGFTAPVALGGCGRATDEAVVPLSDGLRVWRAYASNNSGDCVLVGRFEAVADAEAFVRALLPGWVPGGKFSPAWGELLASEGIAYDPFDVAPERLGSLGAAVLAHTSFALDDELRPLRTRVWRHRGRVVYNGIHEHDEVVLLAGLRVPDDRRDAARSALEALPPARVVAPRGADLFTVAPADLGADLPALHALAERFGGFVSGELLRGPVDLAAALGAKLRPMAEWLFVTFPDAEAASAAAVTLDAPNVTVAGRHVLVSGRVRPRTARYLHRRGGTALAVVGEEARLWFWARAADADAPRDPVGARIRAACTGDRVEVSAPWRGGLSGSVRTRDPARALAAVVDACAAFDLRAHVEITAGNPAIAAVARILADLDRQDPTRAPRARSGTR